MASLEEKRRETIVNLHDLTKHIDKVLVKTNNKKFKAYLTNLKEKASTATLNDQVITKKNLRKVNRLLDKVNKYLYHQVWNHWKIKGKIKRINRLLAGILNY